MSGTDRIDETPDDGLDVFFEAARSEAPPLPGGLAARMLGDAYEVQAGRAAMPPAGRRRRGAVPALLAAIGGWPAMGGLAAATAAGVWIGISPPAAVTEAVADQVAWLGGDYAADTWMVDTMSNFDELAFEIAQDGA